MTSQPRDKTRDSTKHDTAKFGLDLYGIVTKSQTVIQGVKMNSKLILRLN